MMTRSWPQFASCCSLAGMVLVIAVPWQECMAQGRSVAGQRLSGPASRPTFSPYLNLLRDGNPVNNYYGLVRPQQDFQQNLDQVQRNFRQVRQEFDRIERDGTRKTQDRQRRSGHRAQFMSDLHGGATSVGQDVSQRYQALDQELDDNPYSLQMAPTGHRAYFGNSGVYYPPAGTGASARR